MDCGWNWWCGLTSEAQAAWVQAAGTLLALAIAVGVPMASHLVRRRREQVAQRARTRALSLAYLQHFRERKTSLDMALSRYDSAEMFPDFAAWKSLIALLQITKADRELILESDRFGSATNVVQTFLYHAVLATMSAENANATYHDSDGTHARSFHMHATAASVALAEVIHKLELTAADGAKDAHGSGTARAR